MNSGPVPNPCWGVPLQSRSWKQLNQSGTCGIITTHYTNLKHYATSAEGIVNGAMLFDNQKMQPLYQLQVGKPGSSFAFEIARKIGLPEEVLEQCFRKSGTGSYRF